MTKYELDFHEDWHKYYDRIDKSVRIKLAKKIKHLQEGLPARHLRHGLPFFVAEVEQFRIVFKKDEIQKKIILYFVGDHKDYEKWFRELEY